MSRTTGKNRRWRLVLAAAAALAAVTTLTASASATATGGPKPPKQHHFKGFVKGFVTVEFAPGFPFVRSTFDGRCTTPSDWVAHWSGTGKSTITGPITAFGSDCDRVDLATGNLVYDEGVITEYGKNGDLIFATYTNGRGTLGGTIVDDWTITGGTGRFEGATGQGTEEFILLAPPAFDGKPLPFINPWDGWLAYAKKKP